MTKSQSQRDHYSNATHLTNREKKALYNLLDNYEGLFNGTLGTWNGIPYDIKL